jgi:hypothetical protein
VLRVTGELQLRHRIQNNAVYEMPNESLQREQSGLDLGGDVLGWMASECRRLGTTAGNDDGRTSERLLGTFATPGYSGDPPPAR